jgi:hypothetical protein
LQSKTDHGKSFLVCACTDLVQLILNYRTDLSKQQKKDFEIALKTVYDNHKYNPQIYSILSELEGKKPPQIALSPTKAVETRQEGKQAAPSKGSRKTVKLDDEKDGIVEQSLDDFLSG